MVRWLVLGLGVMMMVTTAGAEEMSWTGCGITKNAFMKEMAVAFEEKTGVTVKLSGGGATRGIRSVAAGTSDLGGSCRYWLKTVDSTIHPEEQGARLIQVAWDALVVIAHLDNAVDNISMEQLKGVYRGDISNWSELGGRDQHIGLVTREGKTSGVGYMMRQLVFGDANYEFQARSLEVKSSGPLEEKVETVKSALAVDGISSAKRRKVKFLSLDGVAPTKGNIVTGAYPLFRPLYLVVNKNQTSQGAQDFIDFVLSDEGQVIISSLGTVNLLEGEHLSALWKAKADSLGM